MTKWTEAERYMMEQIRLGNDQAWSQLVERYQGRLIAFARSRTPKSMEAEDLVQDTFLLFLRARDQFREQAGIETYLFTILRRRIAEVHRGKKINVCDLSQSDASGEPMAIRLPAPDLTASGYMQRNDQRQHAHIAVVNALDELIHRMKTELDLQNLQILEMVFYAQQSNQQIAAELGVSTNHVAVQKHRWIKQLRDSVDQTTRSTGVPWDSPEVIDSLLTQIWEEQRPSCPKRSTVGSYVLGTLDKEWQQYVDFHMNRLGCSFCRASREDLQQQSRQDTALLRHRILQSTVGFLRKP